MAGKIYENTTANGMAYSIYIPDNYTANTPVLSYNFSVGANDNSNNYVWNKAKSAVLEQGYDTIVLFPNHYDPDTWNKDYQNNSLEILEDAKERYGIISEQFMTVGFSSSCSQSVKTTAEYIIQNPGVERQIAFAQDGFIWKSGVLTESELNALIENDTLIIDYCQPQNWTKLSNEVITNLDTLIITDKEEYINYNTSYWGRHDLIARGFWEDELYNEILNFIDGTGTLDTSRYNFYIVDDNGQKVKVTDPNELYDLLGIDTYGLRTNKLLSLADFSLTSDLSVLNKYLNDIIEKIRSTSFLNSTVDAFSGSSTTQVPLQVPSCVQDYFNKVSKVLCDIADLTSTVAAVHTNYEQADDTLAENADFLE